MNLKKLANWKANNVKYTDTTVDLVANIEEFLKIIEYLDIKIEKRD
jgi:hypothetical protein